MNNRVPSFLINYSIFNSLTCLSCSPRSCRVAIRATGIFLYSSPTLFSHSSRLSKLFWDPRLKHNSMHLTSLQCYLTINLFASSPPISIKLRLMPSLSTMIFFFTKLTLYLSSAFFIESCRGRGFGFLFRQLAIFVFPTPTSPRIKTDISAEEEWWRELSVPI